MKTNPRATAESFINLFSTHVESKSSSGEFRPEPDKSTILNNLHFVEKIFPLSAVMLCPVSHANFKYISKNCDRILGHSYETLMGMGLPEIFELVHPDDLHAVRKCLDFILSFEPYDRATHRSVMYYRMRNRHGEYIHVRDEKFAVRNENNNYLHLMMFTNAAPEKFYHVKVDVYKTLKDNHIKVCTYSPNQSTNVLTPRQNDIIQLILKGLSNQEIADRLNVSVFTVKNHKRMLFKKVNVKNSIELANYVNQI